MSLSQSSKADADLLSDVLTALGVRATRRAWLEAAGDWALAFPALDRLKFVAVLRGACWLTPAGGKPQPLGAGDVCLIGRTDYVVASDPAVRPVDGLRVHRADGDRLRLGGSDTLLLGGGVAFSPDDADFLLEMLPPMLVVERSTAGAVATVLSLLDREAREPVLGREAMTVRLAEILVIEAIRASAACRATGGTGWLGALADARIGRALQAFHAAVARPWTVAMLATEAGMSRAAFSAGFTRLVGMAPLAYARRWRLALARARLAVGVPIAQVAADVGYTSQSAFGHAYRRALGASPGADRRSEAPRRGSTTGRAPCVDYGAAPA